MSTLVIHLRAPRLNLSFFWLDLLLWLTYPSVALGIRLWVVVTADMDRSVLQTGLIFCVNIGIEQSWIGMIRVYNPPFGRHDLQRHNLRRVYSWHNTRETVPAMYRNFCSKISSNPYMQSWDQVTSKNMYNVTAIGRTL